MEREQTRRLQVSMGVIPPPEPKVKLSNLMRVLGQQAVMAPSEIERHVREQMAQRLRNHEMRNLARKLTPAERREKKKQKLAEAPAGEVHVAVFRCARVVRPLSVRSHVCDADSACCCCYCCCCDCCCCFCCRHFRRLDDLVHPQHKFKLDVNARDMRMTGQVVICRAARCCVVVVEGGASASAAAPAPAPRAACLIAAPGRARDRREGRASVRAAHDAAH